MTPEWRHARDALDQHPVSWRLRDGLMDVELSVWRASDLAIRLWKVAKGIHAVIAACDVPMSRDLLASNRATRMCYELVERHSLTGVDRDDLAVLYEIYHGADTEALFKAFNDVRFRLRANKPDLLLLGDAAAKSVQWIMER